MFSPLRLKSVARLASRSMFTANSPHLAPQREVFVSQTRDLLSNIALEDWASRNVDVARRSLLILSNNITRGAEVDIKVTFLAPPEDTDYTDYLEELVLTSLPPDLLMKRPPLTANLAGEGGGQRTLSVTLDLVKEEVKTKTVLKALETIGKRFLADSTEQDFRTMTRLNLVRPDDGWFPGLAKIRAELEQTVTEVERMKKRRQRVATFKEGNHSGYNGAGQLQNSFGQ